MDKSFICIDEAPNWNQEIISILVPGSGPLDIDGTVGPNAFLKDLSEGIQKWGHTCLRFSKVKTLENRIVTTFDEEYLEPLIGIVYNLISTNPNIKIVLIGHSLGAHLLPQLAETIPNIAGIVLIAPHLNTLLEVLEWQLENNAPLSQLEKSNLMLIAKSARETTKENEAAVITYMRNSDRYKFREQLIKVTCSVLLIGGGLDFQIPKGNYEKIVELLKDIQPKTTSKLYPELNHMLVETDIHDALNVLAEGKIPKYVFEDISNFIQSIS